MQRNPETSVKTITEQRVTKRLGIFGYSKQSEPALRIPDMPAPIVQRMQQDIKNIVNSVRCERAQADERHWAFATAITDQQQQQPLLQQKRDDGCPRKQPRLDRSDFAEAEASTSTTVVDCNDSRMATETARDYTSRSADRRRRWSMFAKDPPFGEIAERILKVVPFVPLQQGKGETYSTAAHRLILTMYAQMNPSLFKTESTKSPETDSSTSIAADEKSPQMDDRLLDQTPEELLTAVSELIGWDYAIQPSSSMGPGDWALDSEPQSPLTMHNEFVFRSPYRPSFSRAQSSASCSPVSSVGTQPFSLDLGDDSFGMEYNIYSIMEEFEPLVGSPPNSPPPSPIDDFNRRIPPPDNATSSLILF
uniref:Uncharacterized protein n=1 Tax=Plectus sambesii TaxID=2011161 RepID=A0A914W0N4_9BILA